MGLTRAQIKAGGMNNHKLHLVAELDKDESDLGNDFLVYNQFCLHVGDSVIQIDIDEDIYKDLRDHGNFVGECPGDEFYSITLDEVLSILE